MPKKVKVKLGGHGEIGSLVKKGECLYNPCKLGWQAAGCKNAVNPHTSRIACAKYASTSKSGGAADRHLVDTQRRLTDAHRHALAFLAAHADARIELHVVADHADEFERFRPAADQRRALDRVGDLAVFDHVRLGGREHELAVRDVDLAAAEVHRVQTVLHGRDDFLRGFV